MFGDTVRDFEATALREQLRRDGVALDLETGYLDAMPGVEPGEALTRELLGWCREGLAGFKVPRSIDYEDELPRLPTGKLYKRLLRDRYWGKNDSRIV